MVARIKDALHLRGDRDSHRRCTGSERGPIYQYRPAAFIGNPVVPCYWKSDKARECQCIAARCPLVYGIHKASMPLVCKKYPLPEYAQILQMGPRICL